MTKIKKTLEGIARFNGDFLGDVVGKRLNSEHELSWENGRADFVERPTGRGGRLGGDQSDAVAGAYLDGCERSRFGADESDAFLAGECQFAPRFVADEKDPVHPVQASRAKTALEFLEQPGREIRSPQSRSTERRRADADDSLLRAGAI